MKKSGIPHVAMFDLHRSAEKRQVIGVIGDGFYGWVYHYMTSCERIPLHHW